MLPAGRALRPLLCVPLLLLITCDGGPADPSDSGGIPLLRIDSLRIEPIVAVAGEPIRVEVAVSNAADFPTLTFHGLGIGNAPFDWLVIHDDGTNGDAVPGDGIFTADGLDLPVEPSGVAVSGFSFVSGLRPVDGEVHHRVQMLKGAVRAMDPTRVPIPSIHTLAEDVRATSHVIAIVADSADPRALANRYYELLPDDRDFLVVLNADVSNGVTFSGRAIHVRQDVLGIGASLGSNSEQYGSAGRLQLLVEMTRSLYVSSNEAGGYCVLTHEINHRWAAFTGAPLARAAHWSFPVLARDSSAFGVDGECIMNDLELYLAGLIPADSVTAPLTADGYTIARITSAHGARIPSAAAAQRDFTIAFIIAASRPLLDHEIAFFHHLARSYTSADAPLGPNWLHVTGGRSTLDGRLPLP